VFWKDYGRISGVKVAFLVILFIVTLWRIFGALETPVLRDEAYYFLWGKEIALGYFDHPPFVAFMATTARISNESWFFGRLGNLIVATIALFFTASLFKKAGLKDKGAWLCAMILANFTIGGLTYGFILTPDTGLLLGWVIGLHEAISAIQGKRKRWITAGLATGIGLLSKYTMALIGPVFIWAIMKRDPKVIKTPWPYAGAMAAILLFLPNLIWNYNHGWITIKYQLRHGLRLDLGSRIEGYKYLPVPTQPGKESPELRLARFFDPGVDREKKREKREISPIAQALKRFLNFLGGQIALWGMLIIPILSSIYLWIKDKGIKIRKELDGGQIETEARVLLNLAIFVPLVFFGITSFFGKVEANWPAMYMVSASAILAGVVRRHLKMLAICSILNMLILTTFCIHANRPILPIKPSRDRILHETTGYRELAGFISGLEGPVFADRHQLASMLRFYNPSMEIFQWPGFKKPSEFTRPERIDEETIIYSIKRARGFWLIQSDLIPPVFKGYVARRLMEARKCRDLQMMITEAYSIDNYTPPCMDVINIWYIIWYEAK
jgi:4-amino-4-deoxy-L-arabinose transferase-like glycosyltransferase